MEINNESILKNRVGKVFKELKISANELQRATGISHSTISSQVNGKSKLAASTMVALLQYNNSISAEWLMRGDGDMLKAGIAIDSPDTISPTNSTDAASTIQSMGINKDTDAASTKNALPGSVAELQSIIRQQQEMIRQQQEQINRLNREIDGLYERIDELKELIAVLKKENAHTTTAHTA